jgi:hypothetical protein
MAQSAQPGPDATKGQLKPLGSTIPRRRTRAAPAVVSYLAAPGGLADALTVQLQVVLTANL